MKKFAVLAILGAAAAGAAAVCAKIIKDRRAQEEFDYTECPCGCEEEASQAQEEVPDAFFEEETEENQEESQEEPEVTIELVEMEQQASQEPSEQTGEEDEETI